MYSVVERDRVTGERREVDLGYGTMENAENALLRQRRVQSGRFSYYIAEEVKVVLSGQGVATEVGLTALLAAVKEAGGYLTNLHPSGTARVLILNGSRERFLRELDRASEGDVCELQWPEGAEPPAVAQSPVDEVEDEYRRCSHCGKSWMVSRLEHLDFCVHCGGEQTKPMKERSKGHQGFFGQWEYFVAADGNLFRAPHDNPLDPITGHRQGARFEATRPLVPMALRLVEERLGRLEL